MTTVKNFGLIGTGSTVQLGKAGPQIVASGGQFYFKNAAQSADVAVEVASLLASTGNISLTSGNLVLSSGGNLTVGNAGALTGVTTGVYAFGGTGALVVPVGTTAQEPTAVVGGFRYNSTNSKMEYSDGSVWNTLAGAGTAVTSVSVASSNGFAGTSSGGNTPTLTLTTTISGLLAGKSNALALAVSGTDVKTVGGNTIIGSGDAGTIGAAYGGTGATTLTGYVYGNGTAAMTAATTIPTSALSGTVSLTTQVSGILPAANGGTGVANAAANTITLGGAVSTAGALTTAGAFALTLTTTAATSVTLPTSGTLATVGNTVASLTGTANQITVSASTGAVTLSIPTAFNPPGTVSASGTVSSSNNVTAGNNMTAGGSITSGTSITAGTSVIISGNTANSFVYSGTAGAVSSTTAPTNGQILIGSTGVKPVVGTITAGTGVSVTNGAGTITVANTGVTSVTVASGTAGLTVANGTVTTTGTATLSLSTELVNLNALSTANLTGFVVRTSSGYNSNISISGTSGRIVVGGDPYGVTANPTIDLATVTSAGSSTLNNTTVDGYGRVSGYTATTSANLSSILGTYYLPSAGGTMSGAIAMGGNSITGLPATQSTNSTSAASKAYVDAAVSNVNVHTAAEAATTANLATTYVAGVAGGSPDTGTGVGATLTATANGAIVIDGYSGFVVNSRVLVKNQTTTTQNGVYIVTTLGTASTPYVLTRASDYNNSSYGEVAAGDFIFVQSGTTNGTTGWVQSSAGSQSPGEVTKIGTDAIVFTQFSGAGSYTAGNGLTLSGSVFSLSTPVTIANGGTGQSTATAAFNALSPITATGDLIVGSGTNSAGRLGIGSTGYFLSVVSGTPSWVTGVTTIAVDGAGSTTFSPGGSITINGVSNRTATTISSGKVVVDISTSYAGQTSITTLGTVATGSWTASTIAAAYGGTGISTYAVGDILYAGTTSTLAKLSDVAAGSYLRSGGVSTAPVWSTLVLPNAATTGDLMYATGTNTFGNLADVATGSVLLSGGVGAIPSYGQVSLTTAVTGVLPAANGGTGVANTSTITLGGAVSTAGAFTTAGAFALTLTTTGATNVTLPTSGTLATVGNTVASFSTGTTGLTPSAATTGAVTLAGTLATTNGGTGLTSFVANELFYAGSTSAMSQSTNLLFDGTSTLTVGGANALTFSGATGTVTSTATNGNIILTATGTGVVQIGSTTGGVIKSAASNSLTITGMTGLILNSTSTAGTVLGLGNTASTITVLTSDNNTSGTTYATAIASSPTALVNKYYVDNAISVLAQSGTIRAVLASVALNVNGTTNIGSVLPAGAIILSVKVVVTTADTAATLSIGKSGSLTAYADTTSNDPSTIGLYKIEDYVVESGAVQVIATVATTGATTGSTCNVLVEYLY